MKRNRKIVLLAHCFLNVNAKVMGIATEAGGCKNIVSGLLEAGYGIIQLPCVEQQCCGCNRWGQVKEQLNFPAFRRKCRELLQPVIDQVLDFAEGGYEISAVIGLDGSPACGVNFTCTGKWGGEIGDGYGLSEKIESLGRLDEPGVMMEVLADMLEEANLSVPFFSVDEANPEQDFHKLMKAIGAQD